MLSSSISNKRESGERTPLHPACTIKPKSSFLGWSHSWVRRLCSPTMWSPFLCLGQRTRWCQRRAWCLDGVTPTGTEGMGPICWERSTLRLSTTRHVQPIACSAQPERTDPVWWVCDNRVITVMSKTHKHNCIWSTNQFPQSCPFFPPGRFWWSTGVWWSVVWGGVPHGGQHN